MKRSQSIAVLLTMITGLLVLLLVAVFANAARQAYDRREAAGHSLSSVRTVRDVVSALELLHVEEGRVRTALSAPGVAGGPTVTRLTDIHARESAALDHVMRDMDPASAASVLEPMRKARKAYDRQFVQSLAALNQPAGQRSGALKQDWNSAVNALADAAHARANVQIASIANTDPFNGEMMKVIKIMDSLRYVAGIGRRMVGEAILGGLAPSPAVLHDLAELDGRFNAPWTVLEADAADPSFPPSVRAAILGAKLAYLGDTRRQRDRIMGELASGARPMSGESWMQISDSGLNALAEIPRAALAASQDHVAAELLFADREFTVALILMIISISLASLTALFVNFRVIGPLRSIVRVMAAVDGGDLKREIPFITRSDEIGEFARALCLFRDNILEKRNLEAALRHVQVARESAEAASRIKSEFLANMSHELRTPLNAVLGFSDLMRSEIFGPLAPQYREYAGLIHESGDHLLNLVSDLLDIAKIEAGKFTLSFQDVELLETVEYCTSLVRRRAQESGVILSVNAPAAAVHFSADPRGLRQILINLLSNAVKFTRKGGRVTVDAKAGEDSVTIMVSDTGIGMSESLLARIGQPFEQASNDPSHAREGTGLGLSLVRAIVAQHGGTMDIKSRENVGTVVTVRLPVAQSVRVAA